MFAAAFFVVAFALQTPAPAPAQSPTDPKQVETAVAELTAAFGKDGTPQKRVEAIQKHVGVVDARVIEWVAKGLVDSEGTVVTASVDALGHMKHPNALESLSSWFKREKKKLADDETLLPQVFKAIGRHGSPSSVELLSKDPFDQRTYLAAQARVMSLGNIRAKEAVEALIDMSKLVGPHRMDGVRNDFRVALAQLTGLDLGPESTAWQKWWQDNKKTFEVAKEPAKLEGILQRQWQRYWGLGEKGEKAKEGEGGGEGGRKRRGGEGKGGDGRGGGDKGGEGGGG
jgi:hypothetical protein